MPWVNFSKYSRLSPEISQEISLGFRFYFIIRDISEKLGWWYDLTSFSLLRKNSSNHNVPFSLRMIMLWFDEFFFFFFFANILISICRWNTIVKQKLDPNHCWWWSTAQTSKGRQTNKTNKSNKITNLTVGHFASSIELKPVLTIDVGFMREVSVCSSSKSAPYVLRVSVAPRYITWPKAGLKI